MNLPEFVGVDEGTNRGLYLLEAASMSDIPPSFQLPSRYFICQVAADTRDTPEEELSGLIRSLLAAGCAYLCSWGAGSRRLHDLADSLIAGIGAEDPKTMEILTTWHEDGPLTGALWEALNASWPAEPFEDRGLSLLVICVGQPGWAEVCREALEDPRAFSRRVLAGDGHGNPTGKENG